MQAPNNSPYMHDRQNGHKLHSGQKETLFPLIYSLTSTEGVKLSWWIEVNEWCFEANQFRDLKCTQKL